MPSPTRNPFDRRPPADPSTEGFLRRLEGPEAADAYRKAMGEEASQPTTDAQEPQLTTDELARLQAIKGREHGRELVEQRKREYLAWAKEFDLGDEDPEAWITQTFTFNPDGTVEAEGDLNLFSKSLTRLPRGLTHVNGNLYLGYNQLTSLEGLPLEIHGDLSLGFNQLTSLEGLPQVIQGNLSLGFNQLTSLEGLPQVIYGYLDLGGNQHISLEGLRGKRIQSGLYLQDILTESIPEDIELGGEVVVNKSQTVLVQDARNKGYRVRVQ